MANALAVKADQTNVVLDKNNPTGLQAAVQSMANALAQQHIEESDQGAHTQGMVFDTMMAVGHLIRELAPWDENTTVAGAAPETGGGDAAVGA